jgi:hypothetical protein
MTECTPREIRAKAPGKREFVGSFDGGDITSDGGLLLLQATEERRGILSRFAECFSDHRDQRLIEHTCQELVAQRVLALALGYEDVVDHERLRLDPLLAAVVGKRDPKGQERLREEDRGLGLASPATLHRLELSHPGLAAADRYCRIGLDQEAADDLLIDICIEAYGEAPEEIVLDLDATDDRVHGAQVGRFYHGHYDHYCFLPLYIFAGDHLLCARLRPANQDGAAGSVEELERIVPRLRAAWPETRIVVRGDSGFCRERLMAWCEGQENIDYVLGLAKNSRLTSMIAEELEEMEMQALVTGEPARAFKDLTYSTLESWSKERRVVAKAEHLDGKANPRFVVTSLSIEHCDARGLYEDRYCGRGEMENRIKEQQLDLFADRTSCHLFRPNQVRVYMSSFAYVLLNELRRIGLAGTDMARAQCGTIRAKLMKVGARVRVTVRKIWVSMCESFPYQDDFFRAWAQLQPS